MTSSGWDISFYQFEYSIPSLPTSRCRSTALARPLYRHLRPEPTSRSSINGRPRKRKRKRGGVTFFFFRFVLDDDVEQTGLFDKIGTKSRSTHHSPITTTGPKGAEITTTRQTQSAGISIRQSTPSPRPRRRVRSYDGQADGESAEKFPSQLPPPVANLHSVTTSSGRLLLVTHFSRSRRRQAESRVSSK